MCGVSQIAHMMSFASHFRVRRASCCLSARRVASLDAPLSPSPPTRLGPRARGYARRRGSTEPPSSQRARRERVRASFYEGRSSSQTLLSRENKKMPEEGFETNRRVERVLGSQTPGTARSSDWAAVHVGENVARASSRRIGSHPIERQDHRRLRRSRFVSERQPHASRRDSSSRARTRGKRHRARRRSRRIRASPRIAAHPASDRGIFERSTRRARGSPGRGVSRWPPWARPARGSEARRSSPALPVAFLPEKSHGNPCDGGGESHLAGGAEVLRERNHELLRGDILHGAGSVRHVANAILCVQASPKEGDGIGLVRGQVLRFHCAARFWFSIS